MVEIVAWVGGSILAGGIVASRRDGDNGTAFDPAGSVDLGPLPEQISFALRRAQTAVFADFIESLSELDLRPAQFAVLEVIDANPGLRQSDAASILGIQKANIVGLISELERRALLTRRRSQRDRRSFALHLRPQGALLLQRARRLRDAQETRIAHVLGAGGRERLLELLRQITPPG